MKKIKIPALGNKEYVITHAPTNKIDKNKKYVHQVLKALGYPGSYITDESMVFDFTFSLCFIKGVIVPRTDKNTQRRVKQHLNKVAKLLGLDSVSETEYIWQVAKRVKTNDNR